MEQSIIESCIKRRIPLPEKIANAPTINRGLEPYYIAFWELTTCRPSGFGVGQIPWTAVDDYARRMGWEDETYEDLLDFTRAMDRTFMAYQKEQSDARAAAEETKRKGPISQARTVGR
jgi:hypothetical protein